MSDERARLPGFDANGNLPPGVYRVSLDDIGARFAWNATRRRLFRGLRRAVGNLAAAGVRRIWIDGSFVTAKDAPNDIDGCWEDGPWVDKDKLDRSFLDPRGSREAVRRKYGLDLQIAGTWLFDVHRPIEAFFQKDVDGNRKGILLIELEQEQ